jgi:hypothetical protein
MIIIIIIMTALTTLKAGIKPQWDSLPPLSVFNKSSNRNKS